MVIFKKITHYEESDINDLWVWKVTNYLFLGIVIAELRELIFDKR